MTNVTRRSFSFPEVKLKIKIKVRAQNAA